METEFQPHHPMVWSLAKCQNNIESSIKYCFKNLVQLCLSHYHNNLLYTFLEIAGFLIMINVSFSTNRHIYTPSQTQVELPWRRSPPSWRLPSKVPHIPNRIWFPLSNQWDVKTKILDVTVCSLFTKSWVRIAIDLRKTKPKSKFWTN